MTIASGKRRATAMALASAKPTRQGRRRLAGQRRFVDPWRGDLERQAQPIQQFAAVARGRAKDERTGLLEGFGHGSILLHCPR
jgi:hypothetical protein